MIIRLSQKLAKKIKVGKLAERPLAENQYADWSANVFNVGRTQYIILCNTKSLYCCFMFSKGVTNDGIFIERMLSTIREFMEDDDLASEFQQHIAPACEPVTFAKTISRSVTGSMNDHVQGAKFLIDDGFSPHELGFRLNGTPLSALTDSDGRKFATPNEVFKLLSRGTNE